MASINIQSKSVCVTILYYVSYLQEILKNEYLLYRSQITIFDVNPINFPFHVLYVLLHLKIHDEYDNLQFLSSILLTTERPRLFLVDSLPELTKYMRPPLPTQKLSIQKFHFQFSLFLKFYKLQLIYQSFVLPNLLLPFASKMRVLLHLISNEHYLKPNSIMQFLHQFLISNLLYTAKVFLLSFF